MKNAIKAVLEYYPTQTTTYYLCYAVDHVIAQNSSDQDLKWELVELGRHLKAWESWISSLHGVPIALGITPWYPYFSEEGRQARIKFLQTLLEMEN